MPARPLTENRLKAAVSVSEMARTCGLSRSHFNHLIRTGVMPQPIYSLTNRRPFYDRVHQELCLRVKTTNTAIDGSYVVFYERRRVTVGSADPTPRQRTGRVHVAPTFAEHGDLVEGLRALGMAEVTVAQVDVALRACYPAGCAGADEGTVLREVWRHLRRTETVR